MGNGSFEAERLHIFCAIQKWVYSSPGTASLMNKLPFTWLWGLLFNSTSSKQRPSSQPTHPTHPTPSRAGLTKSVPGAASTAGDQNSTAKGSMDGCITTSLYKTRETFCLPNNFCVCIFQTGLRIRRDLALLCTLPSTP